MFDVVYRQFHLIICQWLSETYNKSDGNENVKSLQYRVKMERKQFRNIFGQCSLFHNLSEYLCSNEIKFKS